MKTKFKDQIENRMGVHGLSNAREQRHLRSPGHPSNDWTGALWRRARAIKIMDNEERIVLSGFLYEGQSTKNGVVP
ncbi:hypothetical protein MJO28_011055 [Puccinia striiformis f. sp. tritici]|uniref:Uncharacterized protein n=1 Tax=Puccinia striiformis f. sp. tritici TaxID=168172 RepID=A0ACC0E1M0_9BASI|nr:hypothetical protein MJO28_011055 [Puccinia striiformis f. sp. tritici]